MSQRESEVPSGVSGLHQAFSAGFIYLSSLLISFRLGFRVTEVVLCLFLFVRHVLLNY